MQEKCGNELKTVCSSGLSRKIYNTFVVEEVCDMTMPTGKLEKVIIRLLILNKNFEETHQNFGSRV